MSAAIAAFGLVGIVATLQEHRAARGERDDVVDVTVGAVVLGDRVGQPHDALDAEVRPQHRFDLGAPQVRVAVGIEQAALGRHERALAVDRDRSALEHHRHLVHREPEMARDVATDGGVGLVRAAFRPTR